LYGWDEQRIGQQLDWRRLHDPAPTGWPIWLSHHTDDMNDLLQFGKDRYGKIGGTHEDGANIHTKILS